MTIMLHQSDCREVLRTLPDESVHCVVTSPPYWGLRDYGVNGQIGLEPAPDLFVAELVNVFREVRRVLRDDGTLWLNLGDGYKEKNLIGIPWRVAFALQADGWWLRQDIIWSKPNPMPESVTDRCTKAHEYIFLLSKNARYYYDAAAVAEALQCAPHAPSNKKLDSSRNDHDQMAKVWGTNGVRNKRSVWEVATQPFSEAHFATFPALLIEPCILAGCPKGGTVLDPFAGAGTAGLVADRLQRNAILIELNPEYAVMAQRRIRGDAGMFTEIEVQ
jgi:DNA modification methylase